MNDNTAITIRFCIVMAVLSLMHSIFSRKEFWKSVEKCMVLLWKNVGKEAFLPWKSVGIALLLEWKEGEGK